MNSTGKHNCCLARCLLAALLIPVLTAASPSDELGRLREKDPVYRTSPSQNAIQLAQHLGQIKSVEGLQAIIDIGDRGLLGIYLIAYPREQDPRKAILPVAIEQIIVHYYLDPAVGPELLRLISAKYQSKELFELLYAELMAQGRWLLEKEKYQSDPRYADRDWRIPPRHKLRYLTLEPLAGIIVLTDLEGIEQPLVEALAGLSPTQTEKIIEFLGERRVASAVPKLGRTFERAAPNSQSAHAIRQALSKIASQEAADALTARIRQLITLQGHSTETDMEIDALIGTLSSLPSGVTIDFIALYKPLAARLSDKASENLVYFVSRRKDRHGVPYLIEKLPSNRPPGIFQMLVDFASVDVWRQTREGIDRHYRSGRLAEGYYKYQAKRLDELIKDPDLYALEKLRQNTARSLNERHVKLQTELRTLSQLRHINPSKYTTGYSDLLAQIEQLAKDFREAKLGDNLSYDLMQGHAELGDYLRFELKQPHRAVVHYNKALRIALAGARREAMWLQSLSLADTYRFSLNNSDKAIEIYEQMLSESKVGTPSTNEINVALESFFKAWFGHEIRYLRTGESFHRAVSRNEIRNFSPMLFLSEAFMEKMDPAVRTIHREIETATATNNQIQKKRLELQAQLDKFQTSNLTLLRTLGVVQMLPTPEAILTYFRRHDPTGYLSACYLGLVGSPMVREYPGSPQQQKGNQPTRPPNPFMGDISSPRLAAKRFSMERGNTLTEAAGPRKSSAESTWVLFLESLTRGDAETGLSCLTAGMQSKFRPMFEAMSREELKDMARSITQFTVTSEFGDIKEAVIVRSAKGGTQAGFVYFVNDGDEWMIDEL